MTPESMSLFRTYRRDASLYRHSLAMSDRAARARNSTRESTVFSCSVSLGSARYRVVMPLECLLRCCRGGRLAQAFGIAQAHLFDSVPPPDFVRDRFGNDR